MIHEALARQIYFMMHTPAFLQSHCAYWSMIYSDLEVGAPTQILHDRLLARAVRLGLHHLFVCRDGELAVGSSLTAQPKERHSLYTSRRTNEGDSSSHYYYLCQTDR
jgi:hypothetical protein